MINSVGAEKDPYLQAYIQARMKNHVEEVKLQKVLANLEVGRRIKKIMLNMELYEDRKMAHKLKQEASDLETKKKRVMQKFVNSRRPATFTAFASRSDFYNTFDKMSRSSFRTMTEPAQDINTAPPSGSKRIAVFPVTKGNPRGASPTHGHSHPAPGPQDHVTTLSCQQTGSHVFHVVITVDGASTESTRSRKHSFHNREKGQHPEPSSAHNLAPQPIAAQRKSEANISQAVHRRASVVPQLPPAPMNNDGAELDRMKTAATVPLRQRQRTRDVRSVRTLPNLATTVPSRSESRTSRPKTSSLWPGDPNAIRSVRRDRRKPEDMLASVKNGEEARRMIREMPPTCSKNCSKPDILQELGRSYTDLPNLLPAIEKARHEMALKEAASRDIPEENDIEEEPTGPMPVSQIQYMALRSMGGIRRNSLIV